MSDAAILCGGLGTRLASVVRDRPKFLAEVGGRPFGSWMIAQLAKAGVRRAVLCTGYMADAIEAAFGRSHAGVELAYSREDTPLGTGGALRLAVDRIRAADVLVLNGDSACSVPLADFLGEARGPADMLVVRVADPRRYGRVVVAPDGAVTAFEEKSDAPGPAWVNAGVALVRRDRLAAIPAGRAVSLERDVIPSWIGDGLRAVCRDGDLLDIGLPETYAEAALTLARFGWL